MATSVRNATLKVTIEEEINLNGVRQGAKNVKRISDINEIFKRVVTCPANNETTVVRFRSSVGNVSGDVAYDSALDVQDVKDIRVTNLDDANSLTLSLQVDVGEDDSGADMSASILVESGKSFIMGSPEDGIGADDDAAGLVTNLVDLDSIVVQPGGNAVDVEVFVASS